MSKTSMGGVVGFLAGGGLTFVVVTGVFSQFDNEDVANYACFAGIMASPLGGVIGAVIGAAIGLVMPEEEDKNTFPGSPDERPPRKHLCPSCGCQEADGSKTCRWCGADQV
jgi:hypothetical protein